MSSAAWCVRGELCLRGAQTGGQPRTSIPQLFTMCMWDARTMQTDHGVWRAQYAGCTNHADRQPAQDFYTSAVYSFGCFYVLNIAPSRTGWSDKTWSGGEIAASRYRLTRSEADKAGDPCTFTPETLYSYIAPLIYPLHWLLWCFLVNKIAKLLWQIVTVKYVVKFRLHEVGRVDVTALQTAWKGEVRDSILVAPRTFFDYGQIILDARFLSITNVEPDDYLDVGQNRLIGYRDVKSNYKIRWNLLIAVKKLTDFI